MLAGLDEVPWDRLDHHWGRTGEVPVLLRAIPGADPDLALKALFRLGELIYDYDRDGPVCPAGVAALPFLVELAVLPGATCRSEIVRLVAWLADDAASCAPVDGWNRAWATALPALLALLNDAEPAVRRLAGTALANGRDPDGLTSGALRAAADAEPDLATQLTLVLAVGKLAGSAELAWLHGLADDPRVGLAAVVAAHRSTPGIPLDDIDLARLVAGVRGADVHAWADVIDTQHGRRRSRDDRPVTARRTLLEWVRRAVKDDPPAQIHLVDAFQERAADGRRHDEQSIAEVLIRWRTRTRRYLPILLDRLDDPDPRIRARAAHLLAAVAPAAAQYTDRFAALLADATPLHGMRDEQPVLADLAVWALARLGDPRSVPPLVEQLTGDRMGFIAWPYHGIHLSYRFDLPSIGEMLALLPGHAGTLLPGVLHRLDIVDERHFVNRSNARVDYIAALKAWGPAAVPAVPYLIDLLDTPEGRYDAAEALGGLGIAAAAAAPALRVLAGRLDRVAFVHLPAALAHFRVSTDPSLALAALDMTFGGVQRPRDISISVANAACRIAAGLGPIATQHREVLRALLPHNPDAAHALWRVTGEAGEAVSALAELVNAAASGTVRRWTHTAARHLSAMATAEVDTVTLDRVVPVLHRVLASKHRLSEDRGWHAITQDETFRQNLSTALGRWDTAGR